MADDLRQSDGWAKYLASQGWEVEEVKGKKDKVKIYIRRIPLLGSVIKIQRPAEIPSIAEIDRIARKHHALFVKLEPVRRSPVADFEPDRSPNLPTKTILIDLTKSERELWKNLSQDARQRIKKAQGRKLQVTSSKFGEKGFEKALAEFHQLLKETGRRQGFWTPTLPQLQAKVRAFGKDAFLFIVSSPKPIAGALVITSGKTAFYHHAGSTFEGQEQHAPYLLIWEAIRFFKSAGGQINQLDLEGIQDSRFPQQTKNWAGFTTFKNKFGGKEVEHPRPWVRYYHPLIKLIFKISDRLV